MNIWQIKSSKDEVLGNVKMIFKNNQLQYLTINGEKCDRFRLLAIASRVGFENEKIAWEIMGLASKLFHPQDDPTFNELYGAVAMCITIHNQKTESDLYKKFKDKAKKIFGADVQIIEIKNNPKHQPDLWVRIDNYNIPVEIKLKNFDKKALKQLLRYMDFYDCPKGIAIGKSLTVEIPDNIIFISTDLLEDP